MSSYRITLDYTYALRPMTLQTTAAACYTAKLALLKSKTALEPDTRAALTHRHKQKKTPRTI